MSAHIHIRSEASVNFTANKERGWRDVSAVRSTRVCLSPPTSGQITSTSKSSMRLSDNLFWLHMHQAHTSAQTHIHAAKRPIHITFKNKANKKESSEK